MTENQQKEEISKAYVHAIAARCGYKVAHWSQDDDGMDVTICAAGALGGGYLADPKIDLQLKCTNNSKFIRADGDISWQLTTARYDKLRARAAAPKLLIVLVLPEEKDNWITHTTDELILRRCAYWVLMTGKDALSPGTNSCYVILPQTQVFSPEALRGLMERLSREEPLQ